MSIYVEITIAAPIEDVWQYTQSPQLHEQWDLRFTEIDYLPRASENEPQRFRYATRIGFGLTVAGEGESVGVREAPDGSRSSSLKFWSNDSKSLIREGAGYWKYIPTERGIRFLTGYDYQTRFGAVGRLFDRCVFRPLMGWATAWSFDRLRLWLEKGIPPRQAMRQFLMRSAARFTLAMIFYHGLVPKVLFHHPDELAMLTDAGIPVDRLTETVTLVGLGEIAIAAVLLVCGRRRWPAVLCIVLMIGALLSVGSMSPRFLTAAFNPVSLNLAVIALALIDLVGLVDCPSAARCLRAPKGGDG